ncbi:uncharacterized protein LOC120005322 isoform X2 [Tripterygium wilfordii]|uniref:uncharacterized protein LOC120005322 isoform X2 n=1 Tax=Tripterygium wilfordii TaxID=458696 RepID=UPI0018F83283|nr:uncharacterized protein LOC120005322 isoform X2 [Tripterygium wilfordii]
MPGLLTSSVSSSSFISLLTSTVFVVFVLSSGFYQFCVASFAVIVPVLPLHPQVYFGRFQKLPPNYSPIGPSVKVKVVVCQYFGIMYCVSD